MCQEHRQDMGGNAVSYFLSVPGRLGAEADGRRRQVRLVHGHDKELLHGGGQAGWRHLDASSVR